MSTPKFVMTRDINGYNGFGVVESIVKFGGILAADTEDSFTLPQDYPKYIVIFSYTPGSNVWVTGTGTAAEPSAGLSAIDVELNPQARTYAKGTTISMITTDTAGADVSASVYVVDPYID